MPAALQSAARVGRAPGTILMPLSFGSILGGMITLIGTPPNIIVATYRGESADSPFGMFDFTPVGIGVALAGILFIALVGWRLIPAQRQKAASPKDLFDIENYLPRRPGFGARWPGSATLSGRRCPGSDWPRPR